MKELHHPEDRAVFLQQKGEAEGPFDADDVRELLLRNEIQPSTLARFGDGGKWTPISILLNPTAHTGQDNQAAATNPRRCLKLARYLCAGLIIVVGLGASWHLFQENQQSDKGILNIIDHRERLLEQSLRKQAEQLSTKSIEIENLTSQLAKAEHLEEEKSERIERLQADLRETTESLTRETKKKSIFENLSQALAADQQQLRESLLPAIGLPPNLFLSIEIDPGLLKIQKNAVRKALSEPLETAGFNIFFEAPTDRQYILVRYTFSQVSNAQGGFAAYTATIRCVGLAWQSGDARPTILFSEHVGGYAGKNSGYSKSILENVAMFGEMLVDCLGKFDRDALAVDYDMLDPDAELAEAAAQLRSLKSSNEKPVAATGTGFIVSPNGLIVTNHHVIEGHDQVEVWMPATGNNLTAKVIAFDRNNDLAFLRLTQATDLPVDLVFPVIAKALPEVGQTVFTVGFPVPEIMGREPKFSQGVLNAHSGGHDNMRLLQHSIPIQPGNSGGFLISEAGEVCGIVQSTLNAMLLLGEAGALPQNVNYAIKSDRLWDFASDQKLASELSEGRRMPIEVKDGLRLSVLITTRVE